MASSSYDQAQELWTSFQNEVKYCHRFFPSHSVLDMLGSIAKRCELTIDPKTVYYRARIIDDKAAKNEHMVAKCFGLDSTEKDNKWYRCRENKFRGLTKEGSYVPPDPDLISDGRSNPKFIRYLYISESPTTAIFEVRPLLHSAINVAGVKLKEPLKIADIAVDIDTNPKKEKNIEEWLLCFIQSAFSAPTTNPDNYLASQIIAEHIRHLGYDGIRYSSSLHEGGFNLTIFDVSKGEAIFSTDLRLDSIKMSLRPALGAENIDGRFEYIKDNIPMRWDRDKGELVEVEV